jgi:predicted DNA-binding transcriptional regulator YafY
MGQTERLYRIKHQLDAGRCLKKSVLLAELGVSPATLKRDLAHLRDRMNAPVVFDRELRGWRLDRAAQAVGTQYELPGLWLSADEIHALLTMQHLLAHLDTGGLLGFALDAMLAGAGADVRARPIRGTRRDVNPWSVHVQARQRTRQRSRAPAFRAHHCEKVDRHTARLRHPRDRV